MSKIKLIACDLDGTLRPSDRADIPDYNREAVERAKRAGILFCPATGRSFASCRGLVGDMADSAWCITENGGTIYAPGEKIAATREFDAVMGEEIFHHILSRPENEIMITGGGISFVRRSAVEFERYLREEIFEKTGFADSYGELPVSPVKISAFCPDSSVMYGILSPGWTERCNVTIAGDWWVDFTIADKGTGVEDLCRHLGILPENVMAIGDNFNDIPMLNYAGHPVIMESATAELREQYHVSCATVAQAIDMAISGC